MGKALMKDEDVKALTTKIDGLIDKSDMWLQLTTRATEQKDLMEFHTFDNNKLEKIAERMPEVNRASRAFGRKNSQTTNKLITLNMISSSPYRKMKQCLAQIEKKRNALKEQIFNLRRKRLELQKLLDEKDEIEHQLKTGYEKHDKYEMNYRLAELQIEIDEKSTDIADATLYTEGAMKEIGIFQDTYEDIRKENNIPENWDERHFEEAEVEEHIRQAFIHGVRDLLMTGRLNVGTQEYFEQFGINPVTAYTLINNYLVLAEQRINNGDLPDIDDFHDFIDQMYDHFKDEYKKVLDRVGLPNLISPEFLYEQNK